MKNSAVASVGLAKAEGIGLYFHELDVMMCEIVHFSQAIGLTAHFLAEGVLDWVGLESAWFNQTGFREVESIANKFFNVENLDEHPKLAAALMAAY